MYDWLFTEDHEWMFGCGPGAFSCVVIITVSSAFSVCLMSAQDHRQS